MSGMVFGIRSKRQWIALAKSSVSKGVSGSKVEEDLVSQGLDRQSASEYVDEAIRQAKNGARNLLLGGFIAFFVGLVVTIGTYSAATSGANSGVYFLWYGPIIAGVIVCIVALVRLARIRR